MIALDDNGNFLEDAAGNLYATDRPNIQRAKSELRCAQGTWFLDPFFGRNQYVWSIGQSTQDRSQDIVRIAQKYTSVVALSYDVTSGTFNLQVSEE